jgi:hypothetical protein
MDDGLGCFVDAGKEDFFRLLSNVNDWEVPPMNSYSSVDEDVVGVISSVSFGVELISLGLGLGLL